MKKAKWYVLLILIVLLSGCANGNVPNKETEKLHGSGGQEYQPFGEYKVQDMDHKEVVYYLEKQKLGIYDNNTKSWGPIHDVENEFVYNFRQNWEYYTVGHSLENKFEVLHVEKDKISVIRKEQGADCIFPLAAGKGHYFYQQYADKHGMEQKRKILEFYDGKFSEILETKNAICYGTLIGRKLYYSVYNEEQDLFDIYYIKLNEREKKEELYKTGITEGMLFTYEDKLFYINKGSICSEQSKILYEKKDYNEILETKDLLVQMYGNKNGNLQWDFIDLKSGDVLFSYENVINYKVSDTEIKIYCNGNLYIQKIK